MKNVRICPTFSKNLLSENLLLAAGCRIVKGVDNQRKLYMRVISPSSSSSPGVTLMVPEFDPDSKLFFIELERDPTEQKEVPLQNGTSRGPVRNDEKVFQSQSTAAAAPTSEAATRRASGQVESVNLIQRQYAPGASDLQLWHQRLGHRSFASVAKLTGLPLPKKPIFCKPCIEGKSQRHPAGGSSTNSRPLHSAPRPGYLLHSDIAGPIRTKSLTGAKYFLVLIDDFSKKTFVKYLKSLKDFLEVFKEFIAELETQFGHQRVVHEFKADGAWHYASQRLNEYCRSKGIVQLWSTPYDPRFNSVAERAIQILKDGARTMMLQSGVPKKLWAEAVNYTSEIQGRIPRRYRLADGSYTRISVTPNERWLQRAQPNAHRKLRTFGCAAWPLDLRPGKDNMDGKAEVHIMLGVDSQFRSYRLGTLPKFDIVYSNNVIFNETAFPCIAPVPQAFGEAELKVLDDENEDQSEDDGDGVQAQPGTVRRSRRGWQPSAGALEAIAAGAPAPPGQDPLSRDDAVLHLKEIHQNTNTQLNDPLRGRGDDHDETERAGRREVGATASRFKAKRTDRPTGCSLPEAKGCRVKAGSTRKSTTELCVPVHPNTDLRSQHVHLAAGHKRRAEGPTDSRELKITKKTQAIADPKNRKEAMESEHAEYWKEAEAKEIAKLLEHDAFTVILREEIPKGRRIYGSRTVYKVKWNPDNPGQIDKFKCRDGLFKDSA